MKYPRKSLSLILALVTVGCAAPISIPGVPDRPVYAGFDTWRYPGDDLMQIWRESSPYRWVGYYLEAPCHRSDSFSGKRSFLVQNGWGIAVIYVGQQAFEGQTPAEITETTVCSSRLLTAEQGRIDGNDAIAKAQAEGFAPGTVIFLDVERMNRISPEMLEYYQAWLDAVLDDGRYRAGTYAHVANASGLYTVAQRLLEQGGRSDDTIPFWIAGGPGFTIESHPSASGYPFAEIWQGVLDADRSWGGRSLTVDENVSWTPSPSAPRSSTDRN